MTVGNKIEVRADELNLLEIFDFIKKRWAILVAPIFVTTSLSIAYALILPNKYRATAIVAPTSETDAAALSKMTGQFGGLASLAGIDIGSGGVAKKDIAIAILKSWAFSEEFIQSHGLAKKLIAVKGWNKRTGTYIYDEEYFDVSSGQFKDSVNEITSWDLYEIFLRQLNVVENAKTGMIRIEYEYYSPEDASRWVSLLISSINSYMRDKDRKDARESIEYLKSQISTTQVVEMKSVFYKIIEEKTKTLMLTEVGDEYIFKTVSAAKAPSKPSGPKRFLIVLLGLFFGCLLAFFTVVIKFGYMRSENT